MSISLADSAIYGELFSDPQCAALLSDQAEVDAMVKIEAALARVQGRLGIIPAEAAAIIDHALATALIDPATLAAGTASAGVPVPAFVDEVRKAIDNDAARFVHWGATSQDIIDGSLQLRLRDLFAIWDHRLDALCKQLAKLAREHRNTVLAAHTRAQQATPTTLGLKIAAWLAPLQRSRQRLSACAGRLLVVQFGGASGNLAALGADGIRVMDALADELAFARASLPWHTQRDALAELGSDLSIVTASLGKMGVDLIRMAQSEVLEVRPGAGGGSSTMPQKSNPIGAEALVSLAQFNSSLVGAMHTAMLQEHERDGTGWNLEWLSLRPMAMATSTALRHAQLIADTLTVNKQQMLDNLERSRGLVLAEAASFALAEHMPRPAAQALVKSACLRAIDSGAHLMDVLPTMTDAAVDWSRVRDPANYVGVAGEMVDRVLADLARG